MAERAIASTNFPIFLNVTKLAKILDVVRGNETWLKFGYRTIRQFPFSHIYTHTHTNFHLSCITFFSAERTTGNERGKGRKEERRENGGFSFFFLFCYKTGQKALFLRPFVQLFIETNLSKGPAVTYLEYVCPSIWMREKTYYFA